MKNEIYIDEQIYKIINQTNKFIYIDNKNNKLDINKTFAIALVNELKGIFKFTASLNKDENNNYYFIIPDEFEKIQRRKSVRVNTCIPANINCFINTKIYNVNTPIEIFVLNLSEDGLKISTEYEFKIGTNILFNLEIYGIEVKFSAEILREIKNKEKYKHFYGCIFNSVSHQDILRKYIFEIMREELKNKK